MGAAMRVTQVGELGQVREVARELCAALSMWGLGAKEGRRTPGTQLAKETIMAKGQQKSNKEIRKPKKEKPKTNAAAPSRGAVSDIKSR